MDDPWLTCSEATFRRLFSCTPTAYRSRPPTDSMCDHHLWPPLRRSLRSSRSGRGGSRKHLTNAIPEPILPSTRTTVGRPRLPLGGLDHRGKHERAWCHLRMSTPFVDCLPRPRLRRIPSPALRALLLLVILPASSSPGPIDGPSTEPTELRSPIGWTRAFPAVAAAAREHGLDPEGSIQHQ
jgi:hypothetical protein